MSKQYNFKVKREITPNQIMAYIACAIGVVSLFFLAAPGVLIKGGVYSRISSVSVWQTIWGAEFSITPGLVVAFFLTILGLLSVLGSLGFRFTGYLSFLIYVAAGILYFCAVPLIGTSAKALGDIVGLGWGTYVVGILNFLGAVFSYLATRGD